MASSVRLRFEVLKRDNFTCQYCGRRSPRVVLEVDHIVPIAQGGLDDVMNLTTSCWECNRGKSDKPLAEVMTGEDPHDRAILLLEKERQLREYNAVLQVVNARIDSDTKRLAAFWGQVTGRSVWGAELAGLRNRLAECPAETIRSAMECAVRSKKTRGLAYVHACLNNWDETGQRCG